MTRDRNLTTVWSDPAPPATTGLGGQWRIFLGIARSPRLLPVLAVAVLVNPCLYFSVNWLPTYFAQRRALAPGRQMGWILTAIYLGLDLGNIARGSAILALTRWGSGVQGEQKVVFILATEAVVLLCGSSDLVHGMAGAVVALVLVNFGLGIREVSSKHVSTPSGFSAAVVRWRRSSPCGRLGE